MPKYKNHYVIVKRESRKDPPSSTSPKRKLPGIPHDLSTHTVTVTVDLSSSSDASASKTFKSKCFYSTSRTVTKEGLKKSPAPSTVQSCYARTIKSVSNMMDSIALPPLPPKVRLARRRIKLPRNEEPIDFALVFEPLFTLPKTEESKLSDREEFFDCNQCLNHVDRVAFNESSRVKRIKDPPSNLPSLVGISVVEQPSIVDTKEEDTNKKTLGLTLSTGTVPEDNSGSIEKLHVKTEEEVFKSAQSSPQDSSMGNNQAQPQKPSPKPSPLQRVLAPFRKKPSSPKKAVEVPTPEVEVKKGPPIAKEESISDSISFTETNPTSVASVTAVDDDESKYNAVTEFKPNRKKKLFGLKSTKPVPGVWQGVLNETNISCNKKLTRKTITHLAVEALLRDSAKAKAIPRKFKQPIKKKKISVVERTLEVVFVGRPNAQAKDGAFKTWEIKRPILIYKVQAKYPEPKSVKKPIVKPVPVSALAVLNQEISNKRRLRLGTEKTLKSQSETLPTVLSCKASKENNRNVVLDIKRKEEKRAANVTVIAVNVMDVNWAKASKNLKAIADKKKLAEIIERQVTIIEAEKERLSRTPINIEDESSHHSEHSKPVETQASLVLDDLRKMEPRIEVIEASNSHIPQDEDYYPGGPLILPDKSILEEYVKRKRGELERLHSEPVRSPSSSLRGDSPCLSTVSEFLPASSAKIVEPRQKSTAQLTAPQRSTAESVSLPGSNRNSRMIELLPYPPNFEATSQVIDNGNPVSGFRAAIRKPIPKKETLNVQSLQYFDAPKSPFEAAMQSQAAAMAKKTSVTSTISVLSEGDAQDSSLIDGLENGHRRRPSVDSTHSMPPIASGTVAQNYTQAAASQPRHERYAAHIPVRQASVETTGRQSTTSVESANSGALDTASKQLDQMIDQARYKHHQHRSKFKEAIDYLDQIFEDLKKEVDPPTAISSEKKPEVPVPSKGMHVAKAVFQKQVQQPQIQIPPQTTNVPIVRLRKPSDLARQQGPQQMSVSKNGPVAVAKPQPVAFQHPIRMASSQPSTSTTLPSTSNGPKPFPKIESTDVEVSETIVLPAKQNSEKMDFTRQWLSGDIKSWAEKPDLVSGNLTSPNDSDDRSIGSCSAEVAAINAADRKKKRQMKESQELMKSSKTKAFNGQPTIVKPKATVPVKPQPIRPQPQYAPFPTNGQLLSAVIDPPGLQKAPSHEYISAVQRAHQDRAGSQDYQSIGSVHSQEGYKPHSALSFHTNSLNRSGAFQQYPQRGSLHSLPDAAVNGTQPKFPQTLQDPILAIDALVAELELNTEPEPNNDKRRSFPTVVAEPLLNFQKNPAYKAPPQRTSIQQNRNSLGVQQQDKLNGGSIDRSLRRLQMQQRSSLDEMATMLASVAENIKQPKAPPRRYNLQKTPFETINQEKIVPSKVGAIQQMFETKNTATNGNDWRKKNSREEENYYEIQDYSAQPRKNQNSRQNSFGSPSHHGSFPLPQPPNVPPPAIGSSVSSANSSQHGYYSSSTSSVGRNNLPQRHGSFKHSLSSRAASFDDDDDDGFYDNINVESHNRRLSEADNASLSGHQLPPAHSKGGTGRLGQLIRRIGGHGKPPMNASSSVSLNKMGLDPIHAPLTKSSSLSGDPWRQQIIDPEKSLGQKLKQSIFGSKKRLF